MLRSAVVRLTLTQYVAPHSLQLRSRQALPAKSNHIDDASENLARFARWTDECVRPYTNLSDNFNPHGPCRAADALDRGIDRGGVQVGHLLLGDVLHLLSSDLANFVLVRGARALGNASRALQQERRRRGLGDEGERTIAVH